MLRGNHGRNQSGHAANRHQPQREKLGNSDMSNEVLGENHKRLSLPKKGRRTCFDSKGQRVQDRSAKDKKGISDNLLGFGRETCDYWEGNVWLVTDSSETYPSLANKTLRILTMMATLILRQHSTVEVSWRSVMSIASVFWCVAHWSQWLRQWVTDVFRRLSKGQVVVSFLTHKSGEEPISQHYKYQSLDALNHIFQHVKYCPSFLLFSIFWLFRKKNIFSQFFRLEKYFRKIWANFVNGRSMHKRTYPKWTKNAKMSSKGIRVISFTTAYA